MNTTLQIPPNPVTVPTACRRSLSPIVVLCVCVMGIALGPSKASAAYALPSAYQRYDVQFILSPEGGTAMSASMNNAGLIGVTYQYPGGAPGSFFLIQKGVWNTLPPLDGHFAPGAQPTTSGAIGGSYFPQDFSFERGAMYRDGVYTIFPELPGFPNQSWRISGLNDRGRIVGLRSEPDVDMPAQAVLTDVSLSFVAPLQAPWAWITFPQAINNRGHVVGTAIRLVGGYGEASGFYFHDGVFDRIDVPDSSGTFLSGMNERGAAVGAYYDPVIGLTSGLIVDGANMWNFHVPESVGTIIGSISETGRLCGTFRDQRAVDHVFVATPKNAAK
jgi:hypothetical protein